jgi:hypothetical protein
MSQQFFIKLTPPRASFRHDMTPVERQIMQEHAGYWRNLMHRRIAVAFGPVFDPAGVYGIGIVEVEDEQQLCSLIDGDPAKAINDYSYWPMRAVHLAWDTEHA